ncbi:L-asparaginase 1 [Porphyridium purpureum]|uniref:asparaginase n=1 Tax=Porphyridium purpureum TaxID=35688 RepID=A0A5J4YJG8_PORPP|nr:L-asparaginase 1 [Porphyridium purpureum]|eukprot:POR4737..scf210_14
MFRCVWRLLRGAGAPASSCAERMERAASRGAVMAPQKRQRVEVRHVHGRVAAAAAASGGPGENARGRKSSAKLDAALAAGNGVPHEDGASLAAENGSQGTQLEPDSGALEVATVEEKQRGRKPKSELRDKVIQYRKKSAAGSNGMESEGGSSESEKTHPRRRPASGLTSPIHRSKRKTELKNVLMVHTGGTLGMDTTRSFDEENDYMIRPGTGGTYEKTLQPGYLANLVDVVPELLDAANIDLKVLCNLDSSNVGPTEWQMIAKFLHKHRDHYDAFVVVHGTDTMAYTASALSLMLAGFGKPIVMTGSQIPLLSPRSDARQNLIDSITCASADTLFEVAVCFGGLLLRGNRAQKTSTKLYRAFTSPSLEPLATLGVDIQWNEKLLLPRPVSYRPRFRLEPMVMRLPIIPGVDPRLAYGDPAARGVKGIVLEAFGVGNMPDKRKFGWLPFIKAARDAGVLIYLGSQCQTGALAPELYKSGAAALKYGVYSANQMTPECAVVKLMLCLAYSDLKVDFPFAGELLIEETHETHLPLNTHHTRSSDAHTSSTIQFSTDVEPTTAADAAASTSGPDASNATCAREPERV